MNINDFAKNSGRLGILDIESIETTTPMLACFKNVTLETIGSAISFSEDTSAQFRASGCRGTDVVFGITLSKSMDVTAHYTEDGEFILVDIGFCASLWKFFCLLIPLKGHDKTASLPDGLDSISYILDNSEDEKFGLSNFTFEPSDNDLWWIEHCYKYALGWILHHEFAHIWFGHCKYLHLNPNAPSKYVHENNMDLSEIVDFAIECHADDRATHGVFVSNFRVKETNLGYKYIRPTKKDLYDHEITLVYLLLFSIQSLFVFFKMDSPIERTNRLDGPQPRFVARRERFFGMMRSFFLGTSDIDLFQTQYTMSKNNLFLSMQLNLDLDAEIYDVLNDKMSMVDYNSAYFMMDDDIFSELSKNMCGKYIFRCTSSDGTGKFYSNTGKIISSAEYFALPEHEK